MRFRRVILGLLILYWVGIFLATHIPAPRLPATGIGDKTAHVIAYAGLGMLLYLWLWIAWPNHRATGLWVLGICAVYGATDELLQIPIGRHATLGDWIADMVGALAAVAVMELLRLASARRRPATATGAEVKEPAP